MLKVGVEMKTRTQAPWFVSKLQPSKLSREELDMITAGRIERRFDEDDNAFRERILQYYGVPDPPVETYDNSFLAQITKDYLKSLSSHDLDSLASTLPFHIERESWEYPVTKHVWKEKDKEFIARILYEIKEWKSRQK
jgi:hypothetical protein